MKVLVAYATYSSGTDLATQLVASQLVAENISVDRRDIREVDIANLADYDVILFASPSWRTRKGDGSPHEFFLDFIEKAVGARYPDKKFAVLGLGDKAFTHFCGAVDHLEAFIQDLGAVLLIPSLRVDGFYFNQHENEALITQWTENLLTQLSS